MPQLERSAPPFAASEVPPNPRMPETRAGLRSGFPRRSTDLLRFIVVYRRLPLCSMGVDMSEGERSRKVEIPDPDLVKTLPDGRHMYLFGMTYVMDGRERWCEIWAYGLEDAERRVAAMRKTLSEPGQIYDIIYDHEMRRRANVKRK